jgi:hypothetical protein
MNKQIFLVVAERYTKYKSKALASENRIIKLVCRYK